MKGYIVEVSMPFGEDNWDAVDLYLTADDSGGVDVRTSTGIQMSLDFGALVDVIESLSLLLDDLLKEDNDV